MPPKIPKEKLKCFTRTTKEGNKYVNCQDKTKMKGAKKEPAKAPAKKAPVKRKINVVKKAEPVAPLQPVKQVTPPPPPKPTPIKPSPPPANFNMLRPEIRRNVLEFSGAVKTKEAQKTDAILLDKLIDEITTSKTSTSKKRRLLEKYNNKLNKKQPFLFVKDLPPNKADAGKLIDKQIIIDKKINKLREEAEKKLKKERDKYEDDRTRGIGKDAVPFKRLQNTYNLTVLTKEDQPEYFRKRDALFREREI